MLVSFSVSNYRSFGEEVTLNMVASNKLTDHLHHRVEIDKTGKYLLRAAVLYGANGAGKSNLVKAMAFAQRLIQWPHPNLPLVDNFRFSHELSTKPSTFEFRFLIGERVFIYGFDVTTRRIQSEWLAFVAGDDEPVIFERNERGETEVNLKAKNDFTGDEHMWSLLELLRQLAIRPTQLVLNRISSLPENAQGPTLHAILHWLTEELQIIEVGHRSCDLLERLDVENEFREFAKTFLDRIGTGIADLRFEQLDQRLVEASQNFSELDLSKGYRLFDCEGDTYICRDVANNDKFVARRLIAEHFTSRDHYSLPFNEESDGTKQMLHFLPVLSTRRDENRVVVIDELDRSLHPLLCWEFIRFFSDSSRGAKKQLIVTTHESHLLDQHLLRRDEYWFVEKDKEQQSRLTSLDEYNVRKDLKIQKGYLQGRFGAIPLFGSLSELECLLDDRVPEGDHAQEEAPS